jgi:hypothetical protein
MLGFHFTLDVAALPYNPEFNGTGNPATFPSALAVFRPLPAS